MDNILTLDSNGDQKKVRLEAINQGNNHLFNRIATCKVTLSNYIAISC